MVINDKTRTVFNFENFFWGLCQQSLSTIYLNCFKNQFGTCGFADWQFFFKCYPERFFSSLKKTIILNSVKKFETVMVIRTSGRKRVFLKKRFCISVLRTIHFRLNLQARLYRIINYYNIYICNFTFFSIRVPAYWTSSFWIASDEISFWVL